MTTPGLALIGCGGWGQTWARTLSTQGLLVALCDIDPQRLEATVRNVPNEGLTLTCEAHALWDDPRVRGVIVATPATTHVDIACAALRAGKDVLVEKPFALDTAGAHEVATLARTLGRIVMAGHVAVYDPAVQAAHAMLRQGGLGVVSHIRCERLAPGKVRAPEDALWSLAPHDLAVIVSLIGEPPTSVRAIASKLRTSAAASADAAHVFCDFPGGAQASIHVSWLHPVQTRTVRIFGSGKFLTYDACAKTLCLQTYALSEWDTSDAPASVQRVEQSTPARVAFAADPPLQRQVEAFVRAIETRQPPVCDGTHAVQVTEILAAASADMQGAGV